jgi:hypothetical protein
VVHGGGGIEAGHLVRGVDRVRRRVMVAAFLGFSPSRGLARAARYIATVSAVAGCRGPLN